MGIFGQSQQGQPRNDGELHNLQLTEAVFGTCLPIIIGTVRLHAKLIFYGGFYATKAPNSGGKGIFGGKATQFDYFADVISALCQGPIAGLLNVWDQNGKLQNQGGSYAYTIPGGGGSIAPVTGTAPNIQQDLGVSYAAAYSIVANDYGGPGPVTLSGTQQVVMESVSGTPGAGQYNFNLSTGTYTFAAADAGKVVAISWSSVFSLYYFVATQAAEIPGSPYQVSTDNESYFSADEGVYFVADGIRGTNMGGGSLTAHGQYNQGSGVYTFWSGDTGLFVYIFYQYTSSDPDITNSSTLNLTLFNGAQSQSPWSYMTSKYPSAAFGFTGIAYAGANPMALGESASLPSYNYEIISGNTFGGGNLDSLATTAMEYLLTDPLVGVNFPAANLDLAGTWALTTAYHASNGFFISDALNTQSPVANAMQRWLDVGNVAAVWSSGLLKLIPYGDTTTVGNGYTYTPPTQPAFTLDWDDLLPWTDAKTGATIQDDPIQVAIKAPQDSLNYIQCQWTNRENDYNNELTIEQNDAFIAAHGLRPEAPQTWDFATTQTAATWALNLRLKRNCYINSTYKLKLPFWFSAVEPMDLVVLPTGESIRVLQVEDDAAGLLTISAEQWDYGTNDVTLYEKQAPSSYQPNISQAQPGDTQPVFIQNTIPQANGTLNKLQITAVGQNPNWGGCNVYASTDGTTYSPIGQIKSTGIIGSLSANLANSPDPDTTDTLSVDITLSQLGDPSAELVTVSQAQADSFITLCAIVDQSGEASELISYETATLTAQGRYNLTYLRRGVYQTNIGAHTTGANFGFLGPSLTLLDYQYYPQYVGQVLYVKLQSFNLAGNQAQNLSQVKIWALFISTQGSSISFTYSPSAFANTISGGGAVTNAANAYDKSLTSYAQFQCSGTSVANSDYSGFPSGILPEAATLYISYAYTASGSTSSFILQYSLDNGSTFYDLLDTATRPGTGTAIASTTVPAGQQLSDVLVNILTGASLSDTVAAQIFQIWIQ